MHINQIYCGVRGACDGDRSHPRKFALPQQLPCRHPFALHRPFLIGRINQPQLLHVLRPTRKSAQMMTLSAAFAPPAVTPILPAHVRPGRERDECSSSCEGLALTSLFLSPPIELHDYALGIPHAYPSLSLVPYRILPSHMPANRHATLNRAGTDRLPSPPRRRTMSFKMRAEQPAPPAQPRLYPEMYPNYEISWEKLKAWLERRFPGHTFERRVRLPS